MKKAKLLVLLILSLFFGSVSVLAEDDEDVWKPDEPFFTEHAEECFVENREYYANGPNGQVTVYASPVSPEVVTTLENGEIILIEYVYTNDKGITWGFCEIVGEFGWLPMPYMVSVYDYLNFEEDYGDQIQTEKGDLVDQHAKGEEALQKWLEFVWYSSRRVKFWTYPGSSRGFTFLLARTNTSMPKYTKTFVDEDGRKWGFVEYFSGDYINHWVCLSSVKEMLADFEELYPDGAPQRDQREIEPYTGEEILPEVPEDYGQEPEKKNEEKNKDNNIVTIAVGIGVLTGMTIIVGMLMWKKRKKV